MAALISYDPIAIALEICTKKEFKAEVLSNTSPGLSSIEECKRRWDEKVERIVAHLLKDYPNLEELQREEVTGTVFSIAMRMLIWIEFYVGTFKFSRDLCVEFLDVALFTPRGIIDHRSVKMKMSQEELTNLQKFQLACFHLEWREIPVTYKNLSVEDKAVVFDENDSTLINQPNIIKYWSYFLNDQLPLYGKTMVKKNWTMKQEHLRIVTAVTSGSQLAVEYFLSRTKSKQSTLLDIAVSIVWQRLLNKISRKATEFPGDLIVFRRKRYDCFEESWVPDIFDADIFYSIISEMANSQKKKFWDMIFDEPIRKLNKKITSKLYSDVLNDLICWPYQDQFQELLYSSSVNEWTCTVLSNLLLKIVERIEPTKGQFWYGEERCYDYRKMLLEPWTEYPTDMSIELFEKHRGNTIVLLNSLCCFSSFTERDRTIVKSIMESVPDSIWYNFVEDILIDGWEKKENPEHLIFVDRVISCYCHSDPDKIRELKEKFLDYSLTLYQLIDSNKWDLAERLMTWVYLDEISINRKKIELICFNHIIDEMFTAMLSRRENHPRFTRNGGKRLVIEQFMNWFLVYRDRSRRSFLRKMRCFRDKHNPTRADNIVLALIIQLQIRGEFRLF